MNTQERISQPSAPITVKVMARMPPERVNKYFFRQLPGKTARWGCCRFVFEPETDYDWLAVCHDLYRPPGGAGVEKLRCPRENTILITAEPSTITVYGTDYLRQYGTVITSQEPWVISHPNPVFTQPGLHWFYGLPFAEGRVRTYDDLQSAGVPKKDKLISTVCSGRRGRLTLHTRRVHFTEQLKDRLSELEVFGQGVKPMSDKAEALDSYRYHIAVENHVYLHHLTEKLPDAFLGYTLPFYHGCQNATDYFPADSFIPIDIGNFQRTLDIIRSTLANNEYEDRLPYIIEARRRVLEEHNFFAVLERYIRKGDAHSTRRKQGAGENLIMTRQALRLRKPLQGLRGLIEKATVKGRHRLWRLL